MKRSRYNNKSFSGKTVIDQVTDIQEITNTFVVDTTKENLDFKKKALFEKDVEIVGRLDVNLSNNNTGLNNGNFFGKYSMTSLQITDELQVGTNVIRDNSGNIDISGNLVLEESLVFDPKINDSDATKFDIISGSLSNESRRNFTLNWFLPDILQVFPSTNHQTPLLKYDRNKDEKFTISNDTIELSGNHINILEAQNGSPFSINRSTHITGNLQVNNTTTLSNTLDVTNLVTFQDNLVLTGNLNIGNNNNNKNSSIKLDTSGSLIFKQSEDTSGILTFGNYVDSSGHPSFVINKSIIPKIKDSIDIGSKEYNFRTIYANSFKQINNDYPDNNDKLITIFETNSDNLLVLHNLDETTIERTLDVFGLTTLQKTDISGHLDASGVTISDKLDVLHSLDVSGNLNIGNDSNKEASIILDTSGKLVFKQSNDISGTISFGNLTDNSDNPAFVINSSILPITDASGTRNNNNFTPSNGKKLPNIDLGSSEHFFRHIYVSEGTIKFVTNQEDSNGNVEQLVTDAISMDSSTSRVKIAGAIINGNLDISGDNSIIGNLEVSGNTIMHGDLTVYGNATTFSTTNTALKDTLIELSSGFTGEPINNSGLIINRGNEDNAFIGFDESDDKFVLGTGNISGESIDNFPITPGTLKITNIEIENNLTIGNQLDVSGVTISDKLDVSANALLRNRVDISGGLFIDTGNIADTLNVLRTTTLQKTDISGHLDASGVTISDKLDVLGLTTLNNLRVNGNITTSSDTELNNITSIGSGSIITINERNKLIGIKASADITDTANVTSAGAVMRTTIDSKGDILVGTANDTITRLPVGPNNFVLSADSSTGTGLKWKAASGGGGGGGSSTFEGLADTENFSGNAGKILKLNTAENLLEFADSIDGDLTIGDDNKDSFVVNSNSLFTGTFKATGDGDIKEINDYMDLDFGLLTTSRPPQNKTGIYIPYYQYPDWNYGSDFLNGFNNLMNILDKNKDVPVLAIINPNSGPGKSSDPNYEKFIKRLNNHNITIIGYLPTDFGNASINTIKSDLSGWFEFYPQIKGIFLDELPTFNESNKVQLISQYNQIYRMIKSESRRVLKRFLTVTVNTGAINHILYPLSVYEHSGDITNVCFDQIVDHEDLKYPDFYQIETDNGNDLSLIKNFNRGARIGIVHSQDTYDESMVKKMMKYWDWIYITRDNEENNSIIYDDISLVYIEEMCKTFSDNSKFDDKLDKVGNISIGEDNSDLLTINSTINIPGGTTGQSLVKGADGNITYSTVSSGGSGSDITIKNNNNELTTAATTLNFTTGITASESGSTITIELDDDEITSMPNLTSVGTLSSLTVSGNLVADGPTFKIDSENDRVGIGTATPIRPLHIKSEGAVFAIEGNTHSYIEFYPDSYSSGRKGYFGYPGDTNDGLYFINQNNANIIFGTNSVDRLTINGSGDTTLNGSPASNNTDERPRKLEFNLPFTQDTKEGCSGSLIFKDILTGSPNARPSLSVELSVLNPSFTNTPLTIVSHSDTDGRVGIGTTSPSTPLHVNGNITCTTLVGNCSGTSTSINITEDTSSNSKLIIPFTNNTSSTTGSRQLKSNSNLNINPSTLTLETPKNITIKGSSASSNSDERPTTLKFDLPYTADVKEGCFGSLIFKDILTASENARPSLSVQLSVVNPPFTNTPLTIVSHSSTDGRVGIGTTSPSTPLHVNGNITCTTLVGNCSGTSTSVNLTQDTSTDSNFIIPFTNGTSGSRQLKGNSSLTFNPSTGILNGSMIFSVIDNSINRIINPSQLGVGKVKFNFANFNNDNNGPFADAIHFNTYTDFSGGKQNLLMLKKTGIGMRIYQNHNNFDSSGAYSTYKDVVLADSNGNVGIGITSPSTKLHVNGNITCTTLVGNCSGTTTSINITEDTSSNSKLIIPFTNNTSTTTGSRQLKSNSNLNINPSTLTLETPKNITIKGSSASSNSDERPTTLKFDLPFTEGVKEGCFGSLIFKDILTASENAIPSLSVQLSVVNPPFTNTPLTIVSHSSTDGRVGIGTTSPSTPLHVNGNITCTTLVGNCSGTSTSVNITQDTSTNSNFIIPFTNNTSSTTGSRQLKGSSSLTFNPSTGILNGSMIFSVIDNQSNRIITPNQLSGGKVQFNFGRFNNNNTGPYADAIHFKTYSDDTAGSPNLLMLNKNSIGMRIYQGTFDSDSAYSTYKDVVLADSNGNVGIGQTTTPTEKLDINGNLHIEGDYICIRSDSNNDGNTGKPALYFSEDNYNSSDSTTHNDSGNVRIIYDGDEQDGGNNFIAIQGRTAANQFNNTLLHCETGGNVGIGTDNPSQKLEVNGNITATGSIRGSASGSVLNMKIYYKESNNLGSSDITFGTTSFNSIFANAISYTPVSTSSIISLEYFVPYILSGWGTDSYASRFFINSSMRTGTNQYFNSNGGGASRSTSLFPIYSHHINTNGSTITIDVRVARLSSDDNITIFRHLEPYLKIIEIKT